MKRLILVTVGLMLLSACGSLPTDLTGPIAFGSTSSGITIGASSASASMSGPGGAASSAGASDTTTLSETSGTSTTAGVTKLPASGSVPAPYNAFPYQPNPNLSPGDALDVTTADICVKGYSSKVRNVPQSEKNQVYSEYGITSHAPNSYEIDHLISLELGGSNSIKNLWPESYSGDWNAHVKDKLENKLHALVCAGTLDLKTAQQEEAGNWIAAYIKYIGQP